MSVECLRIDDKFDFPADWCANIPLADRESWEAEPPRVEIAAMDGPAKYVIIEDIPSSSLDAIQSRDFEAGEPDIGLNFVVRDPKQKLVQECRGWAKPFSSKGVSDNKWTLKIGLSTRGVVPPRTWAYVRALIECGLQSGFIAPNYALRVDKEPCETSRSKRFHRILAEIVHHGESNPIKLQC